MPQLSKQALAVANNQSFPNNNAGEITPAVLRSYNTDIIDSTVNQTEYTANSGSWNQTLQSLNSKTGSYATTGSNSFIGNQSITGSFQITGSDSNTIRGGLTLFGDTFSKSNLYIGGAYNNYISASSGNGSNFTISGRSGINFDNTGVGGDGLGPIVFTLGGGWPLQVYGTVTASLFSGDGSGLTNLPGQIPLTSLNQFTASQNTKNSTLATYTASIDTKFTTLGSTTSSFSSSINQINAFTASNGNTSLNAFTASQITKNTTLGNLTGSFATTGSNSFVGKQTITNVGSIAIQLTGSLQLTGSNSNTINGQTTINVTGGNGLTINGGGLLSQGAISGFAGLGLYSTDASITIAQNSNNSGSAYSGITTYVDNTTDPTNVFSAINFLDADTFAGMGMGWNSYTGYYPTSVPMIFANQGYNGNDVAIAFPTNVIDLWKPTNVKSGLVVTGSVKQNVVPVSIASSTASLDLSAGTYFTLTLANNTTTHIKPTNLAAGVSATLVITTGTNSSASLSPLMLQPTGSAYTASLGSSKVDILSLVSTNSSNTYVVSAKNFV